MSTALLRLVVSCLILVSTLGFSAENVLPHQDWKTLETKHFKVHYTPEYRDWAVATSHEMEASVAVIKQSQNRQLAEKIDVVIFDPFNDSNGFAITFSSKPIMALYTTPPQSNSLIANSSSWQQLLSLHEYVHLVHLAQPNRNTLTKALSKYWDIYDLFFREEISRWVAEGYATLQESKLTGRGRLYDAQVEAMIRQFAREGALPKYHELNRVEGKYRIGSMAYLVGVRFLHWLEDNYSVADLDAVWTRVQAKERRTFEEAFEGVFLEHPEYLYQRFIAEYTYEVMAEEKEMGKTESKLWYNAGFDLSSPVLTPNQKQLAFIETNPKGDSQIKVVNLKLDVKQETDFKDRQDELLKQDPQDISAKAPKVFNRKAQRTLHERDFSGMRNLRWFDDNNLWFTAMSSDKHGFRHQEIFQWNINSGTVTQLTQEANLRRFDISSDGNFVIAEHTKLGKSGLFKFAVNTQNDKRYISNEGLQLSNFDIKQVYDFPRLNPNNEQQLAYLKSALNQPWGLYITDLSNSESAYRVPMPRHYQFLSYPTWSNDGEDLYFVAGSQTKIKLYQYNLDAKQLFEVTKGQELVAWPIELEKDGHKSLLHTSMMSRGPDLYMRSIEQDKLVAVTEFADLDSFDYLLENTDSKTMIAEAKVDLDSAVGQERDYNIWDQDTTFTLTGTAASASYQSTEVGIKGADLLQRMNWNLAAMLGSDELKSGFAANFEWQGLPVALKAHAYQLELSESASNNFQNSYTRGDDRDLHGYNFTASLPYNIASSTYRAEASVSYLSNQSQELDTTAVRLQHKQSWFMDRVKWGLSQHSNLQVLSGDTELYGIADDWRGVQGSLGFAVNAFGFGVAMNYQHAERNDTNLDLLQLGGVGSGVVTPDAHVNWLFAPELSFGYASGNKYQNIKISLYKRHSGWQLYYSEPEVEGAKVAEIFGLKSEGQLSLFRAGLTDVVFEYGIANVKPSSGKENVEGWLSLRYQY